MDDLHPLWRAACKGDRPALEKLLRSMQDPIYRFCLAQTCNPAIAIEATQETAVRILQSLTSFRGKGKFMTWALGIALNVCREAKRHETRTISLEFENETATEPSREPLLEQESRTRLLMAMKGLTDRQRQCLTLRYFEQWSLTEIAQLLGLSVGTVKATNHSALKKLKAMLGSS